MSVILFGLGGAFVLCLIAVALRVFVVWPFKAVMAYTAWAERKRQKEAEREYYRLPKILGGDGN